MTEKTIAKDYKIQFGKRLKEAMTYRNMSVRELSLKTGVSDRSIRAYINGVNGCRITTQLKLMDALHVTAGYLNGEYPMMTPEAVNIASHLIKEADGNRTIENIEAEIMEEVKMLDKSERTRLMEFVTSLK